MSVLRTIEVLALPRTSGARRVVELLHRHAVPFRWRNVDDDMEARRLLDRAAGDGSPVSYAVSIDGELLAMPSEASVRDRLGLPIDSPAAAFRAFVTGAAETIVVPRAGGSDLIVSAMDSADLTLCATVVDDELWIGAGDTRTLALHRLLTRIRRRDGSLGTDRGYGPPALGLSGLVTEMGSAMLPVSA